MKNKMFLILGVIVILFGALYFAIDYKNKKAIENNENPYGKDALYQETIDQLGDPLYQNQVTPDVLAKSIADKEDITVYFYSPQCSYCQTTTPILVPVAEELNVDVIKFNLLEFPDQWDTYGMEGTPTLIHYQNGEELARLSGQHTAEEFEDFFNEFVVSDK